MQKGQSKSFANLKEFEELAQETFYKNPDEFITALAISKDYQQIQTSNGIYLQPTSPFVNIDIMDFWGYYSNYPMFFHVHSSKTAQNYRFTTR